jgi:TubC N-terminal docking domain
MSSHYLSKLLVRAREAGLTLRAENGYIEASPKSKLTPELKTELREHKAELLASLRWDEERAYTLIEDEVACLAKAYSKAGSPDYNVEALKEPEDRINEAYAREDMFALRIAVREWVLAKRHAFETHSAKDKETV